MKHHAHSSGLHHSRGFSLIELMVALTIGLVIAVSAISAYLGAASASRISEAQSRMNEDAQAALNILTQQLRMAGNNPKHAYRVANTVDSTLDSLHNPVYAPTPAASITFTPNTFVVSGFLMRGCDGKFSNISTAANIDSLTCTTDNAKPDSIAVNYEADKYNTIPADDGTPTDCLGNKLTVITASGLNTMNAAGVVSTTTPVTYTVADNRYYIGTSTAIVSPSLYCKGNAVNTSAQPMVENIEDMQITYGTISTTGDSFTPAGYLTAEQIGTDPTLAALADDASRWFNVVTVRICLVVRSENPVAPSTASASYLKCDGTMETAPPDLRLRRAYSTTVKLRIWSL